MKKKSKKPKEAIKTTSEFDSVRETGVLLEQIKDQISIVAEQHGSIINKLEGHDKEFEKMYSKMEIVEDKIMANSYKIDTNGQKIDRVEKKLDTTIKHNDQRFKKIENKIGI